MSQSKLTAFEPIRNQDGTHKTWESQQFPGINYEFKITMENGDIGTVSSKKPEGNFTIGKEYTYDKFTDTNGRVTLKKFKSVDQAAAYPGGGKPGYNKPSGPMYWDQPEVVRSITKNISMELTNLFLSKMPATIQTNVNESNLKVIADIIYQWCYAGTIENPSVPNWGKLIIERRQMLQRSIEQIPYFHKEILNSNDVMKATFERAEGFITWSQTPHKIHTPAVTTESVPV